jgi:UDP-N-acetylmuramoyl-tripeptide--D-alanyl-D-alanine ligase
MFTLDEVARICGGTARNAGPQRITGASIDTRTLAPGELFFALVGENTDGHRFLARARDVGAAGAVVLMSHLADAPLPAVGVHDPLAALAALGAARRDRFAGPVVAITGSNGKTTTKELCAAILTEAGVAVQRSRGSFNNHLGVPLSILSLSEQHQVLVLEMGMNHEGELDALARIARPDIGAITCVAPAHLGMLGSIEAIARAKGELIERLPASGHAVLNADDANVMAQARRSPARIVGFGLGPAEGGRAPRAYRADGDPASGKVAVVTPHFTAEVELPAPAPHIALDALCALATADCTGLVDLADPAPFARALREFRNVDGRLTTRDAPGGLRILDDSYNANPASMSAALDTLRAMARPGRGFAVLGDMGELGEQSAALHSQVGRQAAARRIAGLICVGEMAEHTVSGARDAGLAAAEVAPDAAAAAARVRSLAWSGDMVLVKGSRAARMERVVTALRDAGEGTE